jgi:UDP-N-acetylmuramoyl-tripeptide--D-alanyl-D-alanine ligase
MSINELYKIYSAFPSVQTDTRKLKPGDLYFALKGENFNGNKFASQAIEKGAACAVIDEATFIEDVSTATAAKIILVEDVLSVLQELAKYHRQQFNIPFIAITGSNGKTTTKELIHAVLSAEYKTYTTEGNLNNHIGVPLTILKIKSDAEMAVIEMGANHQKEIEAYCNYTLPTHGLITNCGKAHLEGFGGVEGVRKGKGELFDFLRTNKGTAFIMQDYAYLLQMSKGISSIIKYGTNNSDTEGSILQSEPFLEIAVKKDASAEKIKTQLVGDYNFPNVLAAVCIGKHFKVPEEKIKSAIESYTPSNSRSQLVEKGTNKIILDAYNANPSSMKLAIENFGRLHASNKILMLGGMAELGEESLQEHQMIIDLIKQYQWKEVILVGGDFLKLTHPFKQFRDSPEAKKWLQSQNHEHVYYLIKGSRSMRMEKVLEQ